MVAVKAVKERNVYTLKPGLVSHEKYAKNALPRSIKVKLRQDVIRCGRTKYAELSGMVA